MEQSENSGFKFWKEELGSPRFILAPMVDQSELAWRMLGRKYGAELCYSPMLHANVFIKDSRYRKESLASCSDDHPLIIQFCANDPDVFVEACKLVVGQCKGVDLNLGCPQAIARRGHYGAFLQDEWDLLQEMVSRVRKEVGIPITCKIRVFEDIQHTIQYAKMLESSGCQILTVHGRTREQKGPITGIASWEHIKAVKNNVKIPVFANGNIQSLADVEQCLLETGVDGVMIAEGSLHNPALFHGKNPSVWEMCLEYLELAKLYPCPISYIRGHIFKLCHHCLTIEDNQDIRQKIATAASIEEFMQAVCEIKAKYETLAISAESMHSYSDRYGLPHPPWICQPYVRPSSISDATLPLKVEAAVASEKRLLNDNAVSRKKLKKLQKNPKKQFGSNKFIFEKCTNCFNPKGTKCSHQLCKACCRNKTFNNVLDCEGHKFYFHTKKKQKDEAPKEQESPTDSILGIKENCNYSICNYRIS